jgi:hypothetical protein
MDEFAELRRSLKKPSPTSPAAPPPPRPSAVPGHLAPDDPARYFQQNRSQEHRSRSAAWLFGGALALVFVLFVLLPVLLRTPEPEPAASRNQPVDESQEAKARRICRNVWQATYRKPIAELTTEETRLMHYCEELGYYKP